MTKVLSYIIDGRIPPRPKTSIEYAVRAIESGVDVLAGQGNGMDAGPHSLGSGEVMPLRPRDVEPLLLAAKRTATPFVFSVGGLAGADVHLDSYVEAIDKIAHANGTTMRVGVVSGEVSKDFLRSRLKAGVKVPRSINTPRLSKYLTLTDVNRATRIQAQMGPEPIMAALQEPGIDGVIAGRAVDVSVLAAYPMAAGVETAMAMHAAKLIECGSMCAEPADPYEAIVADIEDQHFVLSCPNPNSQLTEKSVSAHSLYERENPNEERNPGGRLDVSEARYEEARDGTVHCSGGAWHEERYTVKLEGAELLGYQAGTLCGIRDSVMIGQLDDLLLQLEVDLRATLSAGAFQLTAHAYGRDAVLKSSEPALGRTAPYEIGLLLLVTAETQALALEAASVARTRLMAMDFPGRRTTAGNIAFPLQQAAFALGAAYGINIWHLLPLDDPCAPFQYRVLDLG